MESSKLDGTVRVDGGADDQQDSEKVPASQSDSAATAEQPDSGWITRSSDGKYHLVNNVWLPVSQDEQPDKPPVADLATAMRAFSQDPLKPPLQPKRVYGQFLQTEGIAGGSQFELSKEIREAATRSPFIAAFVQAVDMMAAARQNGENRKS